MKEKYGHWLILLARLVLLLCACGQTAERETIEQPSSEAVAGSAVIPETETSAGETQTAIQDNYATVVYITINPELALYLDRDGLVLAAEYLNEDAAQAFADISLNKLLAGEVMQTVIDTAVGQGYLTAYRFGNINQFIKNRL